jgi:hypothetical protein
VRTLVQNLRVGANWRSVVGPLARATLLHRCRELSASHRPWGALPYCRIVLGGQMYGSTCAVLA